MLKNKIKTKDEPFIQKEWHEYENHVSWWESEQPLSPLPAELQILLIKNDPSFMDELVKFAILTESNYVWNEKTKRYDYTNPRVVLKRDRSWLWTLYLINKPLAKEGLKKLLRYYTYQEFQNLTSNTGVYLNYYYHYGNNNGRNGSYYVLNKNYMRYLKAIYKLTEKRQDHEVWTMLAYRFDIDRSYYTPIANLQNKTPRSMPKYGATPKTRAYLTRRSWRFLRNLGELGSSSYVKMTTDLLLHYTQANAKQVSVTQPKTKQLKHVYSYKQNWLMNHILYHNSTRFTYGSSTWSEKTEAYFEDFSDTREEAFPSLWDKHPDTLLHLLRNANASPIIQFAGRALRLGNSEFVSQLSDEIIQELLQSSDPYHQDFAVRELLSRLDKTNPDLHRWMMLSTHNNYQIRKLANEFLQTHYSIWSKQTQVDLIHLCFEKMNETPEAAYLVEWLSLFENNLAPALAEIMDISMLQPLLSHQTNVIQRFISLLLTTIQINHHPYSAADLLPFLESDAATIRETARNIINKDYIILSCTPDFLAKWCAIPFEDNQVFLTPFFADRMHWLIPSLPNFLDALWSEMMRADIPEESRNYIQNDLLGTMFLSALVDTPLDQILALLDHNDANFQTLGARIFEAKKPTIEQFTVDQLLQLAHNQIALCRSEARNLIIQVVDQVTDDHLIHLVETEWDDTRNWAFSYMRSLSVDQFTPTLVYGLIDSARHDVQAFGMELVEIHFHDLDISELLLRSSESTDLFIQEYTLSLAEKINWDVEKVAKLELFFRTILFKVHQARNAKKMTFALLFNLAEQDSKMAEIIVPLLTDVVHTGGKRDFEIVLAGLTKIHALYPELPTPLQVQ